MVGPSSELELSKTRTQQSCCDGGQSPGGHGNARRTSASPRRQRSMPPIRAGHTPSLRRRLGERSRARVGIPESVCLRHGPRPLNSRTENPSVGALLPSRLCIASSHQAPDGPHLSSNWQCRDASLARRIPHSESGKPHHHIAADRSGPKSAQRKGGIIIIACDVNPFDMNLPESSETPDDPGLAGQDVVGLVFVTVALPVPTTAWRFFSGSSRKAENTTAPSLTHTPSTSAPWETLTRRQDGRRCARGHPPRAGPW